MKKNVREKTINVINLMQKILIKRNLLKPNKKLLVTVSGGQDSICLIVFTLILKKQWNWRIDIVYCNHLWQKKSVFIFFELSKLAYHLNIKIFYTIALQKLINEKFSRIWRYDFFYRLDYFSKNNYLLTGHTFTDRLETIFFNMIRGSGTNSFNFLNWKKNFFIIHEKTDFFYLQKTRNFVIQNRNKQLICFILSFHQEKKIYNFKKKRVRLLLFIKNDLPLKIKEKKSIYFSDNKKLIKKTYSLKRFFCKQKTCKTFYLIRPILFLNRYDVRELIIKTKIMVFIDTTNQIQKYSRNRIRNQLLPTLRFFFNPQIDILYYQYIEIGSMEEQFFEYIFKKMFIKLKYKNKNVNSLDISLLRNTPIFLQRKICKTFFEKNVKKDISFLQIEIILKFLLMGNKKNTLKKEKYEFYKCFLYPKLGILLIINTQLLILTY